MIDDEEMEVKGKAQKNVVKGQAGYVMLRTRLKRIIQG